MSDKDSGSQFMMGFLIGGIIGTIAGILLAPRPGAETRADLFDYGEVVRERAEEMVARVKDEVGPTVESVRKRVIPVIEQISAVPGSSIDRES
jgi:gas vesicle protein